MQIFTEVLNIYGDNHTDRIYQLHDAPLKCILLIYVGFVDLFVNLHRWAFIYYAYIYNTCSSFHQTN